MDIEKKYLLALIKRRYNYVILTGRIKGITKRLIRLDNYYLRILRKK